MTPSTEYDSNTSASSTGSRPTRRRRLWLSIAAAVVVVAIGGTYLTLRETVWAGLAIRWKDQRPGASCPDSRPWITGGLVVWCSGTGITALRISTGRVAWTWHPPRPHGLRSGVFPILDLSVGTDSGVGVIRYNYGYGPGKKDHAVGVEVATGRRLWTSTSNTDEGDLLLGQGRVAVVSSGKAAGVEVRDLATGKVDWSSTTASHVPGHCDIKDAALAGPWVYAMANCTGQFDQLYQLSLKTGKMVAHAPLLDNVCEDNSGTSTLWAVPGYVLLGCEADVGKSLSGVLPYVITAGTVRQRPLSYTGNPPNVDFLPADMNQQDAVASGNSLYLSQDISENDKDSYQIAAIDLKTARLRWDKTITIPDTSKDAVDPANLVGATSRGVLDAIEVVGGSDGYSNSTRMTLATLSASDGHLSYGPATTYGPPDKDDSDDSFDHQPDYYLAGHVLLSFPECADSADCTESPDSNGPVIAYNTGSWPQS